MTEAKTDRDADFVQSLERGLAVICAFDKDHAVLTLSEVAAATGVTHGPTFLLTLVRLGYVRTDGRYFSLTPRVLELNACPACHCPVANTWKLVAEVNESSSVSVLDGQDVVYVARVPVSRIMTVAINVGTRFPAYATSMGRVLLAGMTEPELDQYLSRVDMRRLTPKTVVTAAALRAELARVRVQGFAMVDQELEEGLRSAAAPIRDRTGKVIASLNISAHASRTSLESMRRFLVPPLLAAAARISADLPPTPRRRLAPIPLTAMRADRPPEMTSRSGPRTASGRRSGRSRPRPEPRRSPRVLGCAVLAAEPEAPAPARVAASAAGAGHRGRSRVPGTPGARRARRTSRRSRTERRARAGSAHRRRRAAARAAHSCNRGTDGPLAGKAELGQGRAALRPAA